MNFIKQTSLVLLFVTAFALLACEEDKATYQFCANEDQFSLPAPCDISTPTCQKAVFLATQCVNGSNMTMPPIRIISEAEYLEELDMHDTDTDTQVVSGSTETTMDSDSDEDTDTVNNWDESMRLLGLLAPEKSMQEVFRDDFRAGIGAYYSSEYLDITIIKHDESSNYIAPMQLLAHEFTHAIQDYEYGLSEQSELYSYDDDILISMNNAIEGDASIRSEFAYALLSGASVAELYSREYYALGLANLRRTIAEKSSPYSFARNSLVYATGPLYVYDTYKNEGLAGINRLREAFPTSSVYWMAGYDASHEITAQSPPTHFNHPLHCGEVAAPDGYDFEHQDRMGAALLFAVLSSYRTNGIYDVEMPWNVAIQWRGDSLRIFRESDGDNVAAVWHLRMATAEDAQHLLTLLQERHPYAHAIQIGSEIIEFLANDSTILPNWIQSYTCKVTRD